MIALLLLLAAPEDTDAFEEPANIATAARHVERCGFASAVVRYDAKLQINLIDVTGTRRATRAQTDCALAAAGDYYVAFAPRIRARHDRLHEVSQKPAN